MATGETNPTLNTALNRLYIEAGIDGYDYPSPKSRLRRLGELAGAAQGLEHTTLPLTDYLYSEKAAATPEILGTRGYSHSIASERHPQRNEDNSFVLNIPDRALAGGVFDGLGANTGSERASQIAADIALDAYAGNGVEYMTRAQAALFASQILSHAENEIKKDWANTATTAAIASIHTDPETGERFANFAWAGDSRGYIIRAGKIIYRTLDDSLPGYQPLLDEIFPDEPDPRYRAQAMLESVVSLENYPPELRILFRHRNLVANCLSKNSIAAINTRQLPVRPGDTAFLCTDGVHDNLTNKEIEAIIAAGGGVKELTGAALARSRNSDHLRHKADDITGVILHV